MHLAALNGDAGSKECMELEGKRGVWGDIEAVGGKGLEEDLVKAHYMHVKNSQTIHFYKMNKI